MCDELTPRKGFSRDPKIINTKDNSYLMFDLVVRNYTSKDEREFDEEVYSVYDLRKKPDIHKFMISPYCECIVVGYLKSRANNPIFANAKYDKILEVDRIYHCPEDTYYCL